MVISGQASVFGCAEKIKFNRVVLEKLYKNGSECFLWRMYYTGGGIVVQCLPDLRPRQGSGRFMRPMIFFFLPFAHKKRAA